MRKTKTQEIIESKIQEIINSEDIFNDLKSIENKNFSSEFKFDILLTNNVAPQLSIVNDMDFIGLDVYDKKTHLRLFMDVLIIRSKKGNVSFIVTDTNPMQQEYTNIEIFCNKVNEHHRKTITRKHPVLFKKIKDVILKDETFYGKFDEFEEYFKNLITIKESIKGLTNRELFNKIDREDLKKFLYNAVNQDLSSCSSILDFIKEDTIETIDDFANYFTEQKSLNKLKKIITTRSNKDYINKNLDNVLKNIIRLGVSPKEFKKSFSNKIMKYKTESELNVGLKQYANTISGWSINEWHKKSLSPDIKVDFKKISNDLISVEILDYKTMKELGSTQWCIATGQNYFNEYRENYKKQYIICDFSKESEDPLSMIGVTFDFYGNVYAAYNKNDDEISLKNTELLSSDNIAKFFTKHDNKSFEKRVLENSEEFEGSEHMKTLESNMRFKEMSFYGLTDNDTYREIKDEQIKKISNCHHSYADNNQYQEESLINIVLSELIINDTPEIFGQNKNITEVFDVLKQALNYSPRITEITRRNIILALKKDEDLNVFDEIVKNKGYETQILSYIDIAKDHESENVYKIIKFAFENYETAIKNDIERRVDVYLKCGEVMLRSEKLIDYLKEKDVFKKIIVSSIQKLDDILFNKKYVSEKETLFKTIKSLSREEKSGIIDSVMHENICGIGNISILVDNDIITQELANKSIKKVKNYLLNESRDIMYSPAPEILNSPSFYNMLGILKKGSNNFENSECLENIYNRLSIAKKEKKGNFLNNN